MKRVFDCWAGITARIQSAGSVALFLDFDGTLAHIQSVPEEAYLNPSTRLAITRLVANPRVRVWVISGRIRDDVRGRTRVPGVTYLGLHGWEGRSPTVLRLETKREFECAKLSLTESVGPLRGIRIEDKGAAFAVHYRQAAENESSVARNEMLAAMVSLNGGFRLLNGNKVWEILPREVGDKGSAVRRELSRFEPRALPIYLGDDVTDESAFLALPEGLTIRVGRQALTKGQFQLRDPNEVRLFLEKLELVLCSMP
jgi:trehalose 6-phosphate phosphatase